MAPELLTVQSLNQVYVKINPTAVTREVRIMMADDHFPDVVLVKEALRSQGLTFQMDVCGDGNSALTYVLDPQIHERRPDLIILDLNLSQVSGYDVLKAIRERTVFDQTPVAMLTSSLSPNQRAHALHLKADAFLSKPSHLDEFLSGVGSALTNLLTSKIATAPAEDQTT